MKRLSIFALALAATLVACFGVSEKFSSPTKQAVASGNFEAQKSWVGQYLAGVHAAKTSNYKLASDYFSKSLTLQADKAIAGKQKMQMQVLNLQIIAGDFDSALALAKQLGNNDSSGSAQLLLIISQLKNENYAAMLAELDKAPTTERENIIYHILRLWAEVGAKNNGKAQESIEKLRSEKVFHSLSQFHIALASQAMNNSEVAIAEFRKLAALPKLPSKVALSCYHFFKENGLEAEANSALSKANDPISLDFHKASFRPITTPAQAVSDALIEIGSLLVSEQNFNKAGAFYRLGLYIDPTQEEALILLGTIFVEEKSYELANQLLKQIEPASKYFSMAQLIIARNYEKMENKSSAQKYLKGLAEADDTKVDALVSLGDIAREQENYVEAQKYYDQALIKMTDPASLAAAENNVPVWVVYFARGITYERLNNWVAAETDFKKALELEPNQPDILNYYGYSLLDQNLTDRFEEAKKLLLVAHQERPDDAHIIDSIGWAWFKLGDTSKAAELMEQAAEKMPYDPTVNEHLGDIYWQLGRKTEAQFAWQRALDNKPEERFVKSLEQKIQFGLNNAQIQSAR